LFCLSLILAYLLGSIPFTYLAAKIIGGIDLSRRGSGNLGGTNAVRVLGLIPGLMAGLADVGKAGLAVFLAQRITGDAWAPPLAAAAASLGHSYSFFFLGRKGGKGISPLIGAFALVEPLATALGLLTGLLLVAFTRYVSLGALVFAALLPLLLILFGRPLPWILAASGLAILAYWRHRENIARLRNGTERRIGERA